MRYFFTCISLAITLLLVSCGNKSGSGTEILSEKQMVELLTDTHMADALLFIENSRSEEKRDKALYYYPSVLEKHGITQAQMDSSVAWYMRNPAAYARIYGKVVSNLEKKQAAEKTTETAE